MPVLDPVVSLVLRAGLAALFARAVLHKVRARPAFLEALRGYGLVPPGVAGVVAAALVVGETLVVLALVASPRAGGLGAAALLALYAGAMVAALARGRTDVDCGCGGAAERVPVGWTLVGRNVALIGAALLAGVPVTGRPLVWVDAITAAAAVAALAGLWGAAEGLGTLRRRTRALVRAEEAA